MQTNQSNDALIEYLRKAVAQYHRENGARGGTTEEQRKERSRLANAAKRDKKQQELEERF